MAIGCKVTLRGERMYEFLDRLVNLALPRVRDFRGVNFNAFDGRGNYALGIKEQLIFPEIEYDKVDKVRGMDIASLPPLRLTKKLVNFDIIQYAVCKIVEETFMAKTSMKIKQQRPAKFSTRVQLLQNLYDPSCLFKKVRYLPYLFPRVSIQGSDSGVKKASW